MNEPIPDALWKAAEALVDHYKFSDITKTLRLKSNDFKKHIARLKTDTTIPVRILSAILKLKKQMVLK
jgi:hypothetical protein